MTTTQERPEPLKTWDFAAEFPEAYAGFARFDEGRWEGLIYRVFRYEMPQARRTVSIVYDTGTKEYMVLVQVGLTEFCDIRFIHEQLDPFVACLRDSLQRRLEMLRGGNLSLLESGFRDSGVFDSDIDEGLPAEQAGFQLFLRPRESLPVTNGSYLILDYSDFDAQSGLRIFFNLFRDDYYGEFLLLGVPQATNRFDSRALPLLREKLKNGLGASLNELRAQIDAAH